MRSRRIPVLFMATALILAMAGAASAASLTAKENRKFAVSGQAKLSLDNVNGQVTITAWNQPQIQIEAEKRVKGSESKVKEAMQRLKVEMSQSGNSVTVKTAFDHSDDGFWEWLSGNNIDHSVEYTIMVPQNCDLVIETVNGQIDITGIAGEMKLETTNGAIHTNATSGSVRASTTNGSIDVELRQAQAKPMSCETTNGKITLRVPAAFRATLDASTTNGSIRTDLPITVQGKFDKNSLRGEINGGGPELELETTNGSIHILKIGA